MLFPFIEGTWNIHAQTEPALLIENAPSATWNIYHDAYDRLTDPENEEGEWYYDALMALWALEAAIDEVIDAGRGEVYGQVNSAKTDQYPTFELEIEGHYTTFIITASDDISAQGGVFTIAPSSNPKMSIVAKGIVEALQFVQTAHETAKQYTFQKESSQLTTNKQFFRVA